MSGPGTSTVNCSPKYRLTSNKITPNPRPRHKKYSALVFLESNHSRLLLDSMLSQSGTRRRRHMEMEPQKTQTVVSTYAQIAVAQWTRKSPKWILEGGCSSMSL